MTSHREDDSWLSDKVLPALSASDSDKSGDNLDSQENYEPTEENDGEDDNAEKRTGGKLKFKAVKRSSFLFTIDMFDIIIRHTNQKALSAYAAFNGAHPNSQ
ncbi:hypothetical protein FQA39_LY06056 [Lamprigera yunnana]|nr:hypothetical protein FQA39_LY06056 [Lamprigera yunnana]